MRECPEYVPCPHRTGVDGRTPVFVTLVCSPVPFNFIRRVPQIEIAEVQSLVPAPSSRLLGLLAFCWPLKKSSKIGI